MKNSEGITWMHVEAVPKIPEGIRRIEKQSLKWYCLANIAPEWKRKEYEAQFEAWRHEELEKIHLDWCNPLARS